MVYQILCLDDWVDFHKYRRRGKFVDRFSIGCCRLAARSGVIHSIRRMVHELSSRSVDVNITTFHAGNATPFDNETFIFSYPFREITIKSQAYTEAKVDVTQEIE